MNKDYPEEEYDKNNHYSRKLKADYFIDDRNIGGLPDWGQIYRIIHEHKSYAQVLQGGHYEEQGNAKKKHWWNW